MAGQLAITAGGAIAMVHTPEDEPQQLSAALTAWFEPLVPTVLQLMAAVVQRLQGARAAAAAAPGSTTSATTSSSSSNVVGATEAPHTAVPPLVRLLCLVSDHTQAARRVSPGRMVERCWVWHEQDTQLAAMLDGLVRGSLQFVGSPQDLAGVAGDLSHSLAHVAVTLLAADRLGPVPVFALGRPSDTMEQHTFALCVSLQKASVVLDVVGQADSAGICRGVCAMSARAVVLGEAKAAPAASTHSCTDSTAGATQAATAAVAVLPWLVLFGRCCLHWASEVQQLLQSRPDLGAQLVRLQRRGSVSKEDLSSALQVFAMHGVVLAMGADRHLDGASLAASTAAAVKAWLVGNSRVQVLAGLGYPAEATLQALEAVLASIADTKAAADAAAAMAALGQLAEGLRALGRVLNTLAIPHACNNAGCANLAGATETEMVSGRSCICAGCRVARYCGRSCQTAAWRQHKPVCQRLAVAGAAAKLMQS